MNSRSRFDVIGLLRPLRRYAMVLTRDETEAEDLVHDALVRAYERHHTFRSSGSLRTWLFSVLHNRFVDAQRRKTAEAARVRHMSATIETVAPADQESSVRLQQVRQAFLNLPQKQRAALHLVAVEGLSYQDAAGALGIPLGTLMSRIGRARALLRSLEDGTSTVSQQEGRAHPKLRIVGGSDG